MTRDLCIEILKNEMPHCGKKLPYTEEDRTDAYDMAIRAVKAVKEIDKKAGRWIPHTGRWIPYIPFDGAEVKFYSCSECGEKVMDDTKFCPNCGRAMTGQFNESELYLPLRDLMREVLDDLKKETGA